MNTILFQLINDLQNHIQRFHPSPISLCLAFHKHDIHRSKDPTVIFIGWGWWDTKCPIICFVLIKKHFTNQPLWSGFETKCEPPFNQKSVSSLSLSVFSKIPQIWRDVLPECVRDWNERERIIGLPFKSIIL